MIDTYLLQSIMLPVLFLCSILLASTVGQPFTNTDLYAASKFFIGLPIDSDGQYAKPFDVIPSVRESEEFREFEKPRPGAVYENVGFVKRDGVAFIVNGRPYHCSGTNAFYAGLEYIMNQNEVVAMMKEQKKQGASILRIFTSFFDSVPERYVTFGLFRSLCDLSTHSYTFIHDVMS